MVKKIDPLTRCCQQCGAQRGAKCRSEDGVFCEPHKIRSRDRSKKKLVQRDLFGPQSY